MAIGHNDSTINIVFDYYYYYYLMSKTPSALSTVKVAEIILVPDLDLSKMYSIVPCPEIYPSQKFHEHSSIILFNAPKRPISPS